MSLQVFTEEYIDTALCYSDGLELSEEARGQLERDAMAFYCVMKPVFGLGRGWSSDSIDAGQGFWLTRNGHGAGFWGDWPEPQATYLTEASKAAGPCDLHLGDDGLLYIH